MGQRRRRQRYRSNMFRPKIKRPLSFELTKRGRRQLAETMARGEVSLGDLIEFFLTKYGARVSPERIAKTAAAVTAAQAQAALAAANGSVVA